MVNKFSIALRSRTVWVLVVLFLINGVSGIQDSLSPDLIKFLDPILFALAAYFRVSPKATPAV